MSAHTRLPQLRGGLFLTDGGLETTLIFHEGLELPHFAAFLLLQDPSGRAILKRYYDRYLAIAAEAGLGFILESPTWRSNPDWGEKLGLTREDLARLNREAIGFCREVGAGWGRHVPNRVVSGCVGPRGDGYDPGELMSEEAAEAYHAEQVAAFAAAGADMVCAITMTNVPEAIGVARAAIAAGLPAAISFTVETDGRLPAGDTLKAAITAVDAATDGDVAYYMVNCAHPSHFDSVLTPGATWVSRILGVRANASRRSHQELNEAPDLDAGDPVELGRDHARLLGKLGHLRVLGGCCGTDHRHVASIARACTAVEAA